jgi:hypothetical protein
MRVQKISLILVFLILASCAPPTATPRTEAIATILPSETQSPTTAGDQTALPLTCTEQVTEGDQLFVNLGDANIGAGYCLRYPASFYISYTRNVGRGIHGPSSRPGENIFGGAVVQPLGPVAGNSLDGLADSLYSQAAIREQILIGNVAALLLSGFPQDPDMRIALIIHQGLLFELNNKEITPPGEEPLAQAEQAWQNLLASFAFLPSGFGETYANCPIAEIKTDTPTTAWYVPYINVEEGYCLLFPQDHVLHYDADRRWLLIQKPDPGFNHDPATVTLSIRGDDPNPGLDLRTMVNEIINAQARGEVYRIDTLIAGQNGIFVDGLYSEVGLRHIFFLYNDLLYTLVGSPTVVEERLAALDDLFNIVSSSLTFIP